MISLKYNYSLWENFAPVLSWSWDQSGAGLGEGQDVFCYLLLFIGFFIIIITYRNMYRNIREGVDTVKL